MRKYNHRMQRSIQLNHEHLLSKSSKARLLSGKSESKLSQINESAEQKRLERLNSFVS